jgi:hypothetical protein
MYVKQDNDSFAVALETLHNMAAAMSSDVIHF